MAQGPHGAPGVADRAPAADSQCRPMVGDQDDRGADPDRDENLPHRQAPQRRNARVTLREAIDLEPQVLLSPSSKRWNERTNAMRCSASSRQGACQST